MRVRQGPYRDAGLTCPKVRRKAMSRNPWFRINATNKTLHLSTLYHQLIYIDHKGNFLSNRIQHGMFFCSFFSAFFHVGVAIRLIHYYLHSKAYVLYLAHIRFIE